MKHLLALILIPLMAGYCYGQQRKKNRNSSGQLERVEVIDTPVVEWISYPKDTVNTVSTNIQKLSAKVMSRLPLSQVEIKVNGIVTDVYVAGDFSPAIAPNQYQELIERTVTLRTGGNTIEITVTNNQNIQHKSLRRLRVDPTQISTLRSEKDVNAPMIYISTPTNIREDRTVVYQDLIRLTGTVIDESGIQTLKVNSIAVPVRENGAFVINLPLSMGDNPITVEAHDVNQNIALKKFVINRKNMDGTEYNAAKAKNYLLLIGIDNYRHWSRLNNAVADTDSIRRVLTELYQFDSENVITLTNEQATLANIYQNLRSMIERVTPHDNLLIYYSGHGYFDKLLNEGYWVPVDAPLRDVSAMVPNVQILKIIENINSQHTFLVADACFSGSLFASTTRGYTEHVEKYKSRWGLASGRLEVVSDGEKGANSPFAQSFISFLKNNDEMKTPVSDLVQYVKKKVAEVNEQTPIGNPLMGVGDEGGEFVFYKREAN
jgi:hypothetical protein